MKRMITFLLLGLVFSASACVSPVKLVNGSGVMASKTITFSEVTGVNLATPGEMEIQLGDEPSLLVEMEDNLLPYLETPLQDGRLTIRFADEVNVQPAKPIHYTLTVVELDAIASSSTGDTALTPSSSTGDTALAPSSIYWQPEANPIKIRSPNRLKTDFIAASLN